MSDARARLREHGGEELVERLEHLDRTFDVRPRDEACAIPAKSDAIDVDVVFLGGGLSLLIAAELASLGVSVAVLERARAGAAHREWNASERELEPLIEGRLFTRRRLSELVVASYHEGICRFHRGKPHVVRGVLDRAIDAGPFLEHVRGVAETRGVRFVDHASVRGLGAGPDAVRIAFDEGGARHELTARIAVDARGASSPYGGGDLVCPTVGGVMRGLDFDPLVGDILVTTEDADAGRQHVWEGFPGRAGELTVYLFYYARRAAIRRGVLMDLYARFFDSLATYKTGTPELVRPTFGYITGWSRLTPPPSSPSPRVLLVGDAAARHSPLTFCGFGSMLRSFRHAACAIAENATGGSRALYTEERVHVWTGLLAQVMASEALRGRELNDLLDAAFTSLADLGNEGFAALLQDRLPAREFARFLRATARTRPRVYRDVLGALGPAPLLRWGGRLAAHLAGRT